MFKFKRNMGTLDRSIRIIVGSGLLVAGPATDLVELASALEITLGALGGLAILSAIFAYCFLYEFTDSNTAS